MLSASGCEILVYLSEVMNDFDAFPPIHLQKQSKRQEYKWLDLNDNQPKDFNNISFEVYLQSCFANHIPCPSAL